MKYKLNIIFFDNKILQLRYDNEKEREKDFNEFFNYDIHKYQNSAINTHNVLWIEKIDE